MAVHCDFLPTGYEPIDAEHDRLAEAVERLLGEVNGGRIAGVRAALRELLSLAAAHFAHEERLMADTGYSRRTQHKEAHDLFLGDVSTFARELRGRRVSPKFRRWAVGRLQTWVRFHVAANDVALGAFLAARHRQCRASSPAELADAGRAR
jgi:hemerythrin-like metal-binding protein